MLGAVAYSLGLIGFLGICGGYATGRFASSSMLGFDDDEAQIGLGGAATEHPCCNAPAADFARDGFKVSHHGKESRR